jgi:hypothetical protein
MSGWVAVISEIQPVWASHANKCGDEIGRGALLEVIAWPSRAIVSWVETTCGECSYRLTSPGPNGHVYVNPIVVRPGDAVYGYLML